ncbi:MAG: DUF1778 domain-containing protein [Blastocatellia bacterium]|nr:DUF1778 domain-containing protein [Blastocatellia bacterium]
MPTKTEKSLKAKKAARVRRAGHSKKAKSVKSTKSRSVRLEMRINFQAKSLIERAATLTGQTVTDFAVSNLLQLAVQTIERHQRLEMTDRDRDRFLAALDRPPKPLSELERAARLHARMTKGE